MPPKKQPLNATDSNKYIRESGSLDEEDIKEKMFYFKSFDGSHIYSITENQAKLSGLFNVMIENNPCESDSEEKAISFKVLYEVYDLSTKKSENNNIHKTIYAINTDEMLSFIKEYLDIWKNEPEKSKYVKDEHIQFGDPLQILNNDDFTFLKSFIAKTLDKIKNNTSGIKLLYCNEESKSGKTSKTNNTNMPDLSNYSNTYNESKYNNNPSYKKVIDIQILSGLLAQADFLELHCLFDKICAYIACIIWNASLQDIAEASEDPYFKELQEAAIDEWHAQNNEYIEKHVRSITTGDGIDEDKDDSVDKDDLVDKDDSVDKDETDITSEDEN